MASPRAIRRLAFQVLFQIDARGRADSGPLSPDEEDRRGLDDASVEKAVELAAAAFDDRDAADRAVAELAPNWPAHRQPAVDRAVLRLAHFEMTSGRTPPRVAVSEAVDLAREFGTDKSPGFVNGVLDKVLKSLGADRPDEAEPAVGSGG